jgi:hypothetical protein
MKRRFKNLSDVRRYLANVLNQLESGEIKADDGRVRAYVSSILHKVLIDNELEQRVKALEEKIGAQK